MPRSITVLTPENVELTFWLASPLDRALALILDMMLQILLTLLLAALLYLLVAAAVIPPISAPLIIILLAVFLNTLVLVGYNVLFEMIWNGQTPGKRALRLRVMRDNGFPIDFKASLIRNVVRLLDLMPLNYAVGVISVLVSKNFKRVGDFAAGTIVIREGAPVRPEDVPMPPPLEVGEMELVALSPVALGNIARLRREHYLAIRHFLSRTPQITPEQRTHFARRIALPLMQLLGQKEPDPNEIFHYERFLVEVAWAYERRMSAGTPV